MNEIQQAFIGRLDIFCAGIVLGGLTVTLARMIERWSEHRLERSRKELDLTLGKALLMMRDALDKPKDKGGDNAPHA